MEKTKITITVIKIIIDVLLIEKDEIQENSHLKNDLNADSIDKEDIISELERNFDIKIKSRDAAKIQTVKEIIDYIDTRLR